MPKKKYTAEFKTKVILTIIQGDKEFNAIYADFNLNPSMMRNWKQEFLQNAHRAFDSDSEQKAALRKEVHLKKKNDQMLKIIGQLTLERDFLQGCFHQIGETVPSLPDYGFKRTVSSLSGGSASYWVGKSFRALLPQLSHLKKLANTR